MYPDQYAGLFATPCLIKHLYLWAAHACVYRAGLPQTPKGNTFMLIIFCTHE
jgi:hypothetical protein